MYMRSGPLVPKRVFGCCHLFLTLPPHVLPLYNKRTTTRRFYLTQATFEEVIGLIKTTKMLVINYLSVMPPQPAHVDNVDLVDERAGVLRTVVMLQCATLCALDQVRARMLTISHR